MNRIFSLHLGGFAMACVLGAHPAAAQDTRAEAASQQRAEKARDSSSSAASEGGGVDHVVAWATKSMNWLDGQKDGFHAQFGGLIPGSGWLAAGPGYRHHLFGDAVAVDASAAVSLRRSSMAQSSIELPKLFSDHLSANAQVKYQDSTQINYFGIGPDTLESAQTDYRLKSIDVLGSVAAHPRDWLAVGGRIGYMRSLSVKPGLSSLYPSTDERFDETNTPGLATQPRYQHAEVFVETDTRDVPAYPGDGGTYRVGFAAFHDLDGSLGNFRRVEIDATQYVPLFRRNWLVAVRGRVALSQTATGHDIPFYLLPALGGENSLRGYADYRFRDRNAALLSAEYRWPVFRMMDGAAFVDAGSVGARARELWRSHADMDYGLGLRLHSKTRSIARVDVARGREGMRVIVSLRAPLRGSSRNVAPSLP
jgi:outer membrane protein assembly factor BamA